MRILAIRYSGLGDLVMLLPALARLKARNPEAHITLLTDRSNQAFPVVADGLVDATILFDRRRLKKGLLPALGAIAALFRKLRSTTFDQVIDFHNFGETATISYLAKAPVKRGAPKRSKYHYGYTERVPRNERDHRSQFFCRIAGVDDAWTVPSLHLSESGRDYRGRLRDCSVDNRPVLGLNIGSTQENRRWSHHRFAELARRLGGQYRVLVFIGPGETAYAPAFEGVCEIVTGVSIPQLCGAISCCDYFISNDTGPVHLAGALGVSTLTLFSTGEDWQVGALAERKAWIRNAEINAISVDEVMARLADLTAGTEACA
ncbi:glycosyltransferase family 9 protein [Sedimenticola hydrogenitrophicus]|uniref:glycosyltransferase family 9 protein n=1 Tax=Sedimenticola hydrogenitrophicus TaxID=2967975 RepID=UPI0023AF91CB|nr:glycosyltransferase family 9 protein [Sedimenticola hydrogenitrophicus]